MTSLTDLREVVDVVVGVDTHVHAHSAAAVNATTGGVLDEITVDATAEGYAALVEFADEHATLRAWAIEGTGGHGAGLARHLAQRQEIVGRARPTQEGQAPQRCEAPTPSMRSVLRVRRWRGPGSGPRAAVGSPSALGVGGGPTLGGAGRDRGPAAGVQSGDRCTRAHPCAVPWTEAARHARHGRQPAGAVLLGRRDHHHGAGVAVSGASFPRADRRGSRAREGDPGHRSVLATPTRSRSSGWIRSLLRRCCVPGRTAVGSTLRPRSRCSPGWRRSLPTANR